MSDWDSASARLDDAVDERLADTISYSVDGATFADLPGYVLPATVGIGFGELDPGLGTRWRIKIRQSLIPLPTRDHRLTHPMLGADVWRPAGEEPEEQGRYWIFDIQKAAA